MYGYNHGRFTSPDPLMASATKINPQTFNRYSYVLNNPLNLIDPLGLAAMCPEGRDCYREEGDASYIERYIGDDGEEVITGEPPSKEDEPSAEFQGPLPQNPLLPNPLAQPQTAPSESTGNKFASNVVRSLRSAGPAFGLSLLYNVLANPSEVGGDECDQGIPDCLEDKKNRKTYYRGLRKNGTDPEARLDQDVFVLPDGTLDPNSGISFFTDPLRIPPHRVPAPLLSFPRGVMRMVHTGGTHYELRPYSGTTYDVYLEAQKNIRYGPMIPR